MSENIESIPMLLWCPMCNTRHIDEGEFATKSHKSHECQNCGMIWRPAIVPTVGVQFLFGSKDK
jgi:rubredoxin